MASSAALVARLPGADEAPNGVQQFLNPSRGGKNYLKEDLSIKESIYNCAL